VFGEIWSGCDGIRGILDGYYDKWIKMLKGRKDKRLRKRMKNDY